MDALSAAERDPASARPLRRDGDLPFSAQMLHGALSEVEWVQHDDPLMS